jgi:hypothetical protein
MMRTRSKNKRGSQATHLHELSSLRVRGRGRGLQKRSKDQLWQFLREVPNPRAKRHTLLIVLCSVVTKTEGVVGLACTRISFPASLR